MSISNLSRTQPILNVDAEPTEYQDNDIDLLHAKIKQAAIKYGGQPVESGELLSTNESSQIDSKYSLKKQHVVILGALTCVITTALIANIIFGPIAALFGLLFSGIAGGWLGALIDRNSVIYIIPRQSNLLQVE